MGLLPLKKKKFYHWITGFLLWHNIHIWKMNGYYGYGGHIVRVIAALFSVFMPGFGQIYNKQFFKGIVFVIFEHFDNINGRINLAIHLDFTGHHQEAVSVADFQYLLFYAPFYAYNVWDAMYYAREGLDKTRSAIPFVVAAFLGEMGSIYASVIPFPTLSVGLLMLVPMLFGMITFSRK